jgi:hypothetical protein
MAEELPVIASSSDETTVGAIRVQVPISVQSRGSSSVFSRRGLGAGVGVTAAGAGGSGEGFVGALPDGAAAGVGAGEGDGLEGGLDGEAEAARG